MTSSPVICLMMLIFIEKFGICSFVQMFYCIGIINVRSVSKFYCPDLYVCVCMMLLCGKRLILVHFWNFSLFTINVMTVSLSCFLLLAGQVIVLSYIIVIMCFISLGLLVLTQSLFTCWACLSCVITSVYYIYLFYLILLILVFVFCVCVCVFFMFHAAW